MDAGGLLSRIETQSSSPEVQFDKGISSVARVLLQKRAPMGWAAVLGGFRFYQGRFLIKSHGTRSHALKKLDPGGRANASVG